METKSIVQILDKHVDQQALAKDLVKEFLIPFLKEKAAKTGTSLDDKLVEMLEKAID